MCCATHTAFVAVGSGVVVIFNIKVGTGNVEVNGFGVGAGRRLLLSFTSQWCKIGLAKTFLSRVFTLFSDGGKEVVWRRAITYSPEIRIVVWQIFDVPLFYE